MVSVLVVLEIRSFPLRIVACIRDPWLRYGSTLYAPCEATSTWSFETENKYSRACMAHIQELQRDHRWLTPLDEELAAQSHLAGAIWVLRSFDRGTQGTEPVQSSENPTIGSV
jgi:hypothetical protein